ncbi:helix-turn-helix transcriptional regulator [Microbacterium sp. XT11]|uniref:helix-turn-helix transcriptional regulator n=1 Tax=Microbacterium sp. XT11 TaxID=367477 RepID=UPI000835A275|nr:helix-turn-helix transcriptional regulator [Microbacterium sp. XT11]
MIGQLVSVLRASGQRLALRLIPDADLRALLATLRREGADDVADSITGPSVIESGDRPALTPRELAVLRALARSGSVNDIAAELYVSANTVKSQLRSVYRKLGARNRDEALAAAIHRHLIPSSRE